MIGNGWLRESPRNLIPREWDMKSRSAMRKCMFMQLPPEIQALAADLPAPGPAPVPAWSPKKERESVNRHVRNPQKDVRLMPAVKADMLKAKAHVSSDRAWWEDPIALGTLLIVAPPIGLACVWMSKHYSNDARWALSVMSALVTCFVGAIVVALLFVR